MARKANMNREVELDGDYRAEAGFGVVVENAEDAE